MPFKWRGSKRPLTQSAIRTGRHRPTVAMARLDQGGNVGGYNTFWIDAGDTAIKIDGKYRTSIITDPPNGRQPQMTPVAGMKMAKLFGDVLHENKGDAWWLDRAGPGPYDDPESMTLSDRCLIGFEPRHLKGKLLPLLRRHGRFGPQCLGPLERGDRGDVVGAREVGLAIGSAHKGRPQRTMSLWQWQEIQEMLRR